MSKEVLIFLYRHAETDLNVKDITMGQLNVETKFTDKGFKQIKQIGQNLINNKIQIIYSSDYNRSYETAYNAVMHSKLDLKIIKNKSFRGLNMGRFQGMPYKKFIENKSVIACFQNHDLPFPNGESINQLNQRLLNEIIKICKTTRYKRIAIFSHSAAISNLKSYLCNSKYQSLTMCCFLYKNESLQLLDFVPRNSDLKFIIY